MFASTVSPRARQCSPPAVPEEQAIISSSPSPAPLITATIAAPSDLALYSIIPFVKTYAADLTLALSKFKTDFETMAFPGLSSGTCAHFAVSSELASKSSKNSKTASPSERSSAYLLP